MTSPGGVVALLFTDIVRSTELLSRLGDDAADELRRRHVAALRQAVAASGGEEVKSLGDGLMVSFTSPVAALSCAVAMQDSVEGSGFELRVGVHAGEPIREESDLFGGAVVVAKRLCDAADGGQVLTSQLVVDLVGGRGAFRFRPLGPLTLKGLPEPVRTVAVERADRAEVPAAATAPPVERAAPRTRVRRPRGPRLVGRESELEMLEDELQSAAAGEFRCVLLTAEAGVGKTRLAAELAARHGEGVITLSARAHPMGETAAFGLWAEALDGYLRSLESRDVSRLCGGLLDDLAGLLRSVAAVRGSVPDAPAPRTSLLEGIAVVINNLSRTRPVLILLDDLHQSDASSWETLDYLARGLEAEPVLVVMGARPAELSGQQVAVRVLFGLDQDGFLRRLPLTPLPATGIAELVGEILHSPPAPALVSWLTERSGGNPLFALGLLRALVDEGADLNHPELRRIPENLAERFQGVLATFSEPALAMIEVLSVLGHPATVAELVTLSDRPAEQVTVLVDELIRSRAVVEEEQTGEVRYGFVHTLVQETAYQALGATRRRALHRMVGRALRSSGHVAEAAPHFARSAVVGDDEAIAALLEGIRRAEEREAYRESLTLLSGLVDVLPSGDGRWLEAADALAWQADWVNDRGRGDRFALAAIRAMREIDAVLESSPDNRRRAAVKLRLATFLIYSAGQLEEGLRMAAAAEDLYRAAGEGSGAGLARMNQGSGYLLQGRLAFTARYFEALLSAPEVAADEALATRVRSGLGLALFYSGSFDSDEANLQRNLAEAQAQHQEYLETLFLSGLSTSLAYQGHTSEARSAVKKSKAASPAWRDAPVLEFEAQALWLEGDLTTAAERAEEILEWNPDGLSRRRASGLAYAGMAAMELGRLETARRYVDLAVGAYEGRVYAQWLDVCLHADGVLLAREGHPKGAIETLEAASGRLTENGFRPWAALALSDLADVAAALGDAELAARAAAPAAAVAAGIDRDCYRGLALLAATSAALAAGIEDEAAEHARDAVKVLSLTGWKLFQGRALDGLGRALRHRDPAAARQALDDAAALFEACGATWRRDRALDARP
ncbi:MAG TPA: AAA family ATPase [Acidimicrobiia bacterium]|nr:AAA family ATPase [Acidimicrobiia bacterium]